MNGQIRTDLALEAREMVARNVREDIPGVRVETEEGEDILVTRVQILNEQGSQQLGKVPGNYVTLEVPGLRYKNTLLQEEAAKVLTRELANLYRLDEGATVLVVGLGNWNVTPDALGPRVVHHIVVTRHVKEYLSPELRNGVRGVCAIAPGVLGITGMETAEIIKGIVDRIKPDLVIAIDALAARNTARVGTTIQIADTGIHPGSGVGNKRFGLTKESLGVPVVAIGVPTVVDAVSIANDMIETLQESKYGKELSPRLRLMGREEKYMFIRQVIPEELGQLVVTPKEVDAMIEDIAIVVAGGINAALHPKIDYKNLYKYLQ